MVTHRGMNIVAGESNYGCDRDDGHSQCTFFGPEDAAAEEAGLPAVYVMLFACSQRCQAGVALPAPPPQLNSLSRPESMEECELELQW
jgi:hypothetical protein